MTRFAKKLYAKPSLKREYCVTEIGWTLHGKVWLVFRTCQFIARLSAVRMHCQNCKQATFPRFLKNLLFIFQYNLRPLVLEDYWLGGGGRGVIYNKNN